LLSFGGEIFGLSFDEKKREREGREQIRRKISNALVVHEMHLQKGLERAVLPLLPKI